MAQKKKTTGKEPTFEEALERLNLIVQELETGELTLEDTISHYEEGVKLVRLCRKDLSAAESRIKILEADEQGNPQLSDEELADGASDSSETDSSSDETSDDATQQGEKNFLL